MNLGEVQAYKEAYDRERDERWAYHDQKVQRWETLKYQLKEYLIEYFSKPDARSWEETMQGGKYRGQKIKDIFSIDKPYITYVFKKEILREFCVLPDKFSEAFGIDIISYPTYMIKYHPEEVKNMIINK